jgi:hypothetical protein
MGYSGSHILRMSRNGGTAQSTGRPFLLRPALGCQTKFHQPAWRSIICFVEKDLGPSSLLGQASTLRFPPMQLSPAQFRGVFNRLSAVETFNYAVTREGAELVTPVRESGEQTKIILGKDSVKLEFDPTGKSVEFAAEELVVIMKEVAMELRIPVFIHQLHVLRKTIPLAGKQNACAFLLQEILRLPADRLGGWKRPFSSVGLRFVFPPRQVNELSAHDLRIDSFMPDPSKLLVENSSNFLVPMPTGQWDTLKSNLLETSRFLDDYIGALLRPRLSPEA